MYGSIGLGTFPLAGPFSSVDQSSAIEIINSYLDAGGTYIDVAPTYAFGGVEKLVGEVVSERPRHTFAISTSCGYVLEEGAFRISGKRDDVLRDIDESLQRLGLDFVDIYISHIPDVDTPFTETAAALQELKDQGLARQIGVSNVSAEQLLAYASAGEISVVQNRLSFLNRTLDEAMRSALASAGAELVAYQVIERGLLTTRGPRIASSDDLRRRKPEFEPARFDWVRQLVEGPLAELAGRHDMDVEELVVRWATSQEAVGLAQLGATSADDARRIAGLGAPLSSSVLTEADRLYEEAEAELVASGSRSVRHFLGLEDYDVSGGSASGQ